MKKWKKVMGVSTAVGAALMIPELAQAASTGGIGGVASQISGQFSEVANMIGGASYLMGAGFGAKGALKLKEHNENPTQVKLSSPLTYLAVSGSLLALPSVMDTGASTIFGSGASKTSVSGGL